MDTCIALGIEGSEINLLAHVTATSDAKVLAGVINDTFGSEEGLVIKVWNYGPKGNPISGSTRSVIDESLSQLQVPHQIHVVIAHTDSMTDTAEVGA